MAAVGASEPWGEVGRGAVPGPYVGGGLRAPRHVLPRTPEVRPQPSATSLTGTIGSLLPSRPNRKVLCVPGARTVPGRTQKGWIWGAGPGQPPAPGTFPGSGSWTGQLGPRTPGRLVSVVALHDGPHTVPPFTPPTGSRTSPCPPGRTSWSLPGGPFLTSPVSAVWPLHKPWPWPWVDGRPLRSPLPVGGPV